MKYERFMVMLDLMRILSELGVLQEDRIYYSRRGADHWMCTYE